MTERSNANGGRYEWLITRVGSRRAAARVLVGGALGGVLASTRFVTPALANSRVEFFFCKKCRGLWSGFVDGDGVCPAGGGHSFRDSHNFQLHYDLSPHPTLESDWRVCSNCGVLFWKLAGICPGGAGHNGTNSPNYSLQYNTKPTNSQQGGWRYCPKCKGLFRPKRRKRGVCPGGGKHEVYPGYKYNLDIWVRAR